MPAKIAEQTATYEEINRRLTKAGQRWTNGRRSVVAVFEATGTPLSAIELQAKVGPSVPLSTLYRILSDLVEAKIIIKLEFAEGFARFEFSEDLSDHHHHLACTECGAVADFELHDLEAVLESTSKGIKRRSGFVVHNHRLDFFGLCAKCAKPTK